MRTFALYKRPDAGPSWYFRFMHAGVRYQRCLNTKDRADAQRLARARYTEITRAIIRGSQAELAATRLRRAPSFQFGAVLTAYETAPVKAKAKARRNNIGSFRLLLAACGLGAPETLRPDQINASLARTWWARGKASMDAAPTQLAAQSVFATTESKFNQANSLFAAAALDWYRQHDCYSPSFEDFSKTGRMLRRTLKPNGETMFVTADDATIARTLAAWSTLDDRDTFLAIGLSLAFGLRVHEIAQARWDWLKTFPGYPVLYGEADVKKGTGWLSVRALDPYYTTLVTRATERAWITAPTDYIISGTKTYRTDKVFRATGHWLRSMGWATRKTNHALRALAGSQVIMRYGALEARNWLRHESLDTTEAHYSHYVKSFRPANPDDIPARWATVTQLPGATFGATFIPPGDSLAFPKTPAIPALHV